MSTIPVEPLARDAGLRPRVVRHLMQAIFTQKLQAGDRLVVAKLAAQLGASATPVREALVELESFGLVALLPNRGAVCLAFDAEQLREIYELRRVLEVEAARQAAGHLPPQQVEKLQRDFEQLREADPRGPRWSERAARLDRALHTLLAEHCGSRRLAHEIQRYQTLMDCLRAVAGNQRNVQQRSIGEHLAILQAVARGRADAAAQAMHDHLRHTTDAVTAILFPAAHRKPTDTKHGVHP